MFKMQQKCIVCENQVEKQDEVCSKCGTPIERNERLKNVLGNIVVVAFFIIMIGGIAWLVKYLMF
jgi:predicted nucleic acid-binding Zn ribbon protein